MRILLRIGATIFSLQTATTHKMLGFLCSPLSFNLSKGKNGKSLQYVMRILLIGEKMFSLKTKMLGFLCSPLLFHPSSIIHHPSSIIHHPSSISVTGLLMLKGKHFLYLCSELLRPELTTIIPLTAIMRQIGLPHTWNKHLI